MKTNLKFIITIALCILFGENIHAESRPEIFRHITAASGLPDNQIEGVNVLPDGRLLILSPSMLSLYDGNEFQKYPYSNINAYYWPQGGVPVANYIDSNDRIWIKTTNSLHVFDLGKEQYISNIDSLLSNMGIEKRVSNIFVGDGRQIWFVADDGTLLMNDGSQTRTITVPSDEHTEHLIIGMGTSAERDWLVTSHGEVLCWDIKTGDFMRRDTQLSGQIMAKDRVIIAPSKDSDFWLMWDNGIAYYDFLQSKWIIPENARIESHDIYTSISTDAEGNAWVGTGLNGVYYIDQRTMRAHNYEGIPMIDGNTIHNDITNICVNNTTGDVWIAFIFRGIAYGHANINMFNHHGNQDADQNVSHARAMAMAPDGRIMLGTLGGLRRYNPKTGTIDVPIKELAQEKCRCLFTDSKGRLWVGTLFNGLYLTDGDKVIRHYYNPQVAYHVFNNELSLNSILAINEDARGDIWVSVRGGLCHLDEETGELTSMRSLYPALNHYNTINSIYTDPDSCILLGSTDGYCVFKPEKGVRLESRKISDFSCDFYNYIFRDSRGLVWLGTQNGLQVVNRDNRSMHPITLNEGLGNSAIKCIVEDQLRNIWVSTSHGIDRIEVTHDGDDYEFKVRPYTESDGLLAGEYYGGSGVVADDGTIYFGGLDGFTSFNPAKFVFNTTENQPVITDFQIANTIIKPGQEVGGNIILDRSIGQTKSIDLDYDQNFITIHFSGLNFANPEQTSYRYRLVGLDDEWTEESFINQSGKVAYSNLSPGHYTFEVITANSDKVWTSTPTRLEINIAPPFYDTIWARIVYVLIAVCVILFIARDIKRKNQAKIERIRQTEAQKQKEELDQMKYQFFTNISHEFRTPLTLIITPLQSLLKRMDDGPERQRIHSIYRNATHLLGLVNQLLDFRKVEMKGSSLKLKNANIRDAVATTVDAFRETAAEKGIKLTYEASEIANPYMTFDPGKIYKILNNLLSNALKYTHAGGSVNVTLTSATIGADTPAVELSVADTGIGIPAKDLPHVFERFFQASNNNTEGKGSSGIGLHLIKELTDIHKGEISVESSEGRGTKFTVLIPANLHIDTEAADNAAVDSEPQEEAQEAKADERPMVLVVEDNEEFRSYMCSELSDQYRVIDAPDGEKGEKLAIENNPDLIISDVMMPIMDGIEMCRHIKENVQTSHIPVVLLTAKASDESRTEGYEAGADAYLTKPFDIDALFARIHRLIEQKQQRQETFRKEITVEPSTITITSVDERLVQKALECVEKNMDNSEYSVDELGADLAMTRATLYRKMQGITGQTPKDFIRTIRVKRAAQLLRDSKLSVSEVGYMTGFTSPRIFSKNFKEVMGVLPSQYAEKDVVEEQ